MAQRSAFCSCVLRPVGRADSVRRTVLQLPDRHVASTWDWSIDRLWLSVLPGRPAAALGGLIMALQHEAAALARRTSSFLRRSSRACRRLWFIDRAAAWSMLWNGGTQATGAGRSATTVPAFSNGSASITARGAADHAARGSYGLGFLAALPVTGEAVRSREREPASRGRGRPAASGSRLRRSGGAERTDGALAGGGEPAADAPQARLPRRGDAASEPVERRKRKLRRSSAEVA